MFSNRFAMTAIAGVGIISATVYATRKNEPRSDDAQIRRNKAQATRRELPAGGVGGGEASSKSDHFRLHSSILGGGGKTTASRQDHEGYHDTRGISKMGAEIPSKRGPAHANPLRTS